MDYQPFFSPIENPESFTPRERDENSDRKQISVIGLGTVFVTFVPILVQLILMIPITLFFPETVEKPWFLVLFSSFSMYAVAMPLSLLIYRMAKAQPPATKKIGIGAWLGLLAVCFALTYVGNFIGVAVNTIIEIITGIPANNQVADLTANTPFWVNLLCVGILAPILEEIFYRKIVIDRLRTFGDLPAILISGLLFGLLHGNFGQFFYATLIGFVFGMIYLRTGRLRYSISLHMAINLLGGVLTAEIFKRLDVEAMATDLIGAVSAAPIPFLLYVGYLAFLGLCLIGAPVAVILMRRQIRFEKADIPLTSQHWVRILICNPITWITLLALAATFVLSIFS